MRTYWLENLNQTEQVRQIQLENAKVDAIALGVAQSVQEIKPQGSPDNYKVLRYKILVQKSWKSKLPGIIYIEHGVSPVCDTGSDINIGIRSLFYLHNNKNIENFFYRRHVIEEKNKFFNTFLNVLGKPKQSF